MSVAPLATAMFAASPVVVTTRAATAATPKAIDPTRLTSPMRHPTEPSDRGRMPRFTSDQASALATRKHTEP